MQEDENKNISHHILPTASTLLGLCFLLIGSIRAMGLAHKTVIDDLAAIDTVIFLLSCVFSYASIRNKKMGYHYERIADLIFLSGLGLMTLMSFLLVFELID